MDARIVDGRKIARVTDDGKLKVLVHGRDGDDLVPVKVSEDGYLMLATDVTVEGVTVDLGTVELNQGAPGQNPWPVTLSGNIAEKASAQHSESATTVKTYTRAAGAARIEVYVESGRVRIRTDGQPCTAVTGEPLGEGFGAAWAAPSISVLFVSDAVITVVSR